MGQYPSWYDSVHSWWHYSAAPLGNQAISTRSWYQSHYSDTKPTSSCPILIMPSIWLGSNKCQFYESLVWLNRRFELTISRTRNVCSTEAATVPGLIPYVNNDVSLTEREIKIKIQKGKIKIKCDGLTILNSLSMGARFLCMCMEWKRQLEIRRMHQISQCTKQC